MNIQDTLEKLKAENKLIRDLFSIMEKYRKYFPLIAFIVGFSWDSLTLSRIDRVIDNIRLLIYLIVLYGLILITNFIDRDVIKKGKLLQYKDYYPIGIHFIIGSLFSAFVIYYFQSASLSKNILFVGILAFFLVAIEFLNNRLKNIYFQFGLLFLVNFAYFTFFVPVIAKSTSIYTFVVAGVISVSIVGSMIALFYFKGVFLSVKQVYLNIALVLTIFFMINWLYALNLIPPVPLSLKMGGVYHSIEKQGNKFALEYETMPWYHFWSQSDPVFHFAEGDQIIGFTAIFAPNELKEEIVHHWQRYVVEKKQWVTYDVIGFEIEGGRERGFRGHTKKKYIANGEWRIEVRTKKNRLLGRVYFEVQKVEKKSYELKKLWV
ncbi:MAG: DUF2914 domain-containing protein [Deltaproteobacteria bacterium]|nr:DUF2914 domain-containing protein [Deltaproteobacteria bacterium]